MTFLNPQLLWGLPLILIPVIIHLINRLRHRPQVWAAMQFLRAATQSSVSQAKLRHFLILLFRVLAVTALILFVARPLAGGWLGWALAPAPEVVLLLLDRSPSMETTLPGAATTKRQQALKLWGEAARQYQGSSRFIFLDGLTGQAQESGSINFLSQLSATQPSDAALDFPGLLQRSLDYLLENKSGGAEIWIASDLQAGNWVPQDSRWEKLFAQFSALPQKPRFRLLTFEQAAAPNSSISLVELTRRVRNGRPELSVVLDLERTASASEATKLVTTINGTRSEADLQLTGTSLRWRQVIPLSSSLTNGHGSFELPADANLRDNIVHFVFGEIPPASSSVIATHAATGRLLQIAAGEIAPDKVTRAKLVSIDEVKTDDWTTNALVVWQAPFPSGETADRLAQFIQTGGVVLFLPTEGTDTNLFAQIGFSQTETAPPPTRFAIGQINELDGPLARTEEGFLLPLGAVEFYKRARITGAQTILAAFGDNAPFLVRHNLGRGEAYFCASLPASEWSTLDEGPVLVPMLQRMLSAGARRLHQANFIEAGRTPALAREWKPVSGQGNALAEAGIYQEGARLIAVNRPAIENELQFVPVAEIRRLFATLPVQLHEEKAAGRGSLQGEIWRFFLVAMLLFLLAEGWLILPPKSSSKPDPLIEGREAAA